MKEIDYKDFIEELIKELQKNKVNTKRIDNDILRIEILDNGSLDINLKNIYNDYLTDLDKKNFIKNLCCNILVFFEEIYNKYNNFEYFENFETIKDNIFPVIKSKIYPKSHDIIYKEYNKELQILYAVDTDNSLIYIKKEDLFKWGKSIEQIHNFAINNLNDIPSAITEIDDEIYVCSNTDGYTSSRLLMNNIYLYYETQVNETLYLAIPTRDDFILFTKKNIPKIRRYIIKRYNTNENFLSLNIFYFDKKESVWKILF